MGVNVATPADALPAGGTALVVAHGVSGRTVAAELAGIDDHYGVDVHHCPACDGLTAAGLKLADGAQLPAALRELVHQFAGIISWIWMLVDDDDRTLADIVGKTHVVHVGKD